MGATATENGSTAPPAPGGDELALLLLRQRDAPAALGVALEWLVEASGARGAALCFAQQGLARLRLGEISPDARSAIEQWEGSLLARLAQGPLRAEIFSQTALPDGQTLLKLPLAGPEAVAGSVVLLLPPRAQLTGGQFDRLRSLCQVAGSVASVLQALATTQRRVERLSLLYEAGKALSSTLELQQLLHDTMGIAATAMAAQASTLMLVDPADPASLVFEIAHGIKREQLRRYRMPISEGIAGWVATHGQPVIVNRPDRDPRFNRKVDMRTGFLTRNIICVPMALKGVVIGVLQVLNKPGGEGFDDDDLELLQTLASQAAVAILNARLVRDLRDERDRIIAAQEDVRRELSRHLHDGPVQQLAAMSMSLDHARRLADRQPQAVAAELDALAALNQRALRQARTLLFELRPVVLETRGLGAALVAYAERLNEEAERGGRVALTLPAALPRLPPLVERTVFDIVQEAVGNARKHAQAPDIFIRATGDADWLSLTVQDNGIGFDMAATQARAETSGSLGLLNMRERAALIEASWRLRSAPGQGTRVSLRVPLRPAAEPV